MSYRARIAVLAGIVLLGDVVGAIMIRARVQLPAATVAAAYSRLCAAPPPSLGGVVVILRHNIAVCLSLLLSPLTFGIRLVVQGLRIGFDITAAYKSALVATQSRAFAFGGLAPHGILEVPAFVSVGATGLGMLVFVIQAVRLREIPEWRPIGAMLMRELPVPLLMLLTAAFIEEFVTAIVLRWISGC